MYLFVQLFDYALLILFPLPKMYHSQELNHMSSANSSHNNPRYVDSGIGLKGLFPSF